MQTISRRYFPQRSFSLQVFCYCLKLCLRAVRRITIGLLKCRCSLRLVQGRPFSYTASIDSNSASGFTLAHSPFSTCLRSCQSIRCGYFPPRHSYAPSLIDSVFFFHCLSKREHIILGSAWVHRVLVSICLGRGSWCFQFSLISHRICDCKMKAGGRSLRSPEFFTA